MGDIPFRIIVTYRNGGAKSQQTYSATNFEEMIRIRDRERKKLSSIRVETTVCIDDWRVP